MSLLTVLLTAYIAISLYLGEGQRAVLAMLLLVWVLASRFLYLDRNEWQNKFIREHEAKEVAERIAELHKTMYAIIKEEREKEKNEMY
jgi:hypothetical protein